MIALDKGTLPRRIGQNSTSGFAGENAYWYCNTCHQWRTNEIQHDGSIACPICGNGPDWKKHRPTLAYGSRHKRVADLCAVGSGWRKSYDAVEQSYASFIEEVNSGLPFRTQEEGWKYFQNAWRAVDELADYLLTAPDAPTTDSAKEAFENMDENAAKAAYNMAHSIFVNAKNSCTSISDIAAQAHQTAQAIAAMGKGKVAGLKALSSTVQTERRQEN